VRSSGAEFGKQGGLQNRVAVDFLHRDSAGHAPRNRIAQSVHDKPHTVLAKESEGASAAREVGDGLGVVKHNQCPSTTSKTSTIIGPRQAGTVGIGGVSGGENHHATEEDIEDFQTIYAANEGAVTAPATGLHFSRELLKRMEIRGINSAFITLHCGLGNFHDIEVEDLTKHKVDSESMHIGAEACAIVNKTKAEGRRVCAIGTSVVKATETAVGTDGMLKEYTGWTNRFIFPPYDFGLADTMMANFYHPLSTLLMSTAAFGGYDLVMEAYRLAVENEYKFGCFGDALLILND